MIYYIYPDVPSTQDVALAYINRYRIPSECVAFRAMVQSQGYGRRGTVWKSELGNLALSVLLPLTPCPRYRDHLALYIAECVQNLLEKMYGIPTTLKLPNDILWGGKKIVGILVHIVEETAESWCAVVGIGMNVNHTPHLVDANYQAVSLFDILGCTVDLEQLTQCVLHHLRIFNQHYT